MQPSLDPYFTSYSCRGNGSGKVAVEKRAACLRARCCAGDLYSSPSRARAPCDSSELEHKLGDNPHARCASFRSPMHLLARRRGCAACIKLFRHLLPPPPAYCSLTFNTCVICRVFSSCCQSGSTAAVFPPLRPRVQFSS